MNYYIRNKSIRDPFIESNINQFYKIITKSPSFNNDYYVYRLIGNDNFLNEDNLNKDTHNLEQLQKLANVLIPKIEKETEYYLLLNNKDAKKQTLSVIAFSKKNVFLGYQILTQFDLIQKGSQFYGKTLLINKEPTFLIEENKLDPELGLTNEKKGWAYTEQGFRLIYLDANIKPEQKAILNPIDTLPTKNTFSGDYARDKKNFIALRDFGNANKYQFFLHFEKKEGTCVGELKGLLNFNKNQATYSEKGDPCTIQFTITGNVIKIKEDGNCGNHRNMTCYFNDSYDKKRKAKSKK
jgi:hypothetical protein